MAGGYLKRALLLANKGQRQEHIAHSSFSECQVHKTTKTNSYCVDLNLRDQHPLPNFHSTASPPTKTDEMLLHTAALASASRLTFVESANAAKARLSPMVTGSRLCPSKDPLKDAGCELGHSHSPPWKQHSSPCLCLSEICFFCASVYVMMGGGGGGRCRWLTVWFSLPPRWAWVLQDALGIAFCLYMLKTVRLPTFKVQQPSDSSVARLFVQPGGLFSSALSLSLSLCLRRPAPCCWRSCSSTTFSLYLLHPS